MAISLLEKTSLIAPEIKYVQKELGRLYDGIDDEKAFKNFKAEAEKGDAESMYKTGRMSEEGKGTEKNIKYAVEIQ